MPFDEPDATDPMMFVGVSLPASEEANEEMAYTFAEELFRLDYTEDRVLHVFLTPFYRAPYAAWLALGEEKIRQIVGECASVWGRVRVVDCDRVDSAVALLDIERPGQTATREGESHGTGE